jgi:1-deoxy-D-xylulose-5-phosphate synthase
MNEQELRNLMFTAQLESTCLPFVIRYPRGEGVMPEWRTPFEPITIGKGRKLREGKDVAVLSLGHPGNFVQAAIRELTTDGIDVAHYDMRFAKPLDEDLLHEVFHNYNKIITVEDGTIIGGFGSAIIEFMAQHNYHAEIKLLGIPDRVVEHGTLKELHRECNYDAQGIANTVRNMVKLKVSAITKSITL